MRRNIIAPILVLLALGSCIDREADFTPMSPPNLDPVEQLSVYEGYMLFGRGDEDSILLYLGQPRTSVERILGRNLGESFGSTSYRRGGVDYEVMYDASDLTIQIRLYGNRFLAYSNTQRNLFRGGYGDVRTTLESRYGRPATTEYEHWIWPENGIIWYPDVATGRVKGVAIRKPTLRTSLAGVQVVDFDGDGYASTTRLDVKLGSTVGNKAMVAWIDYRPKTDTTKWITVIGPHSIVASDTVTQWTTSISGNCTPLHEQLGLRLRLAYAQDTTTMVQIRTLLDTLRLESQPEDGIKAAACTP